ncbi:syntaxin-11 isoform 4-T21 [Alca torda]
MAAGVSPTGCRPARCPVCASRRFSSDRPEEGTAPGEGTLKITSRILLWRRSRPLWWSEQGCSCQLGLNHDKRESEVACGSMCRSGMEQKILELFLLSRRIHRICWQQAKPQRWYLWRETLELTKKLPAAIYLLTSTSVIKDLAGLDFFFGLEDSFGLEHPKINDVQKFPLCLL